MTFRLTSKLGMNVKRMPGSNQKIYLTYVAWYPRHGQLGYLYWSHRSF